MDKAPPPRTNFKGFRVIIYAVLLIDLVVGGWMLFVGARQGNLGLGVFGFLILVWGPLTLVMSRRSTLWNS